jgi:hypothetical protein
MSVISEGRALERAKRYRELAHEARVQAAHSKGFPLHVAAYIRMAGRWEELALEADANAGARPAGQERAEGHQATSLKNR